MRIGDTARRTRTVTARDIELFTEITGDRNPLHYDEELARASRFGRIIVQGGVTSGLLNAVVAEDLPGPGSVFLETHWRFLAPVGPGDTITAEVEVLEHRDGQADHEAPHHHHRPGRHRRARRHRGRLPGRARRGLSDVEDDLADRPAVGDVAQRGGRLVERERRADVRDDAARGEQLQQLVLVAVASSSGVVRGEVEELEAEDLDALQQHEVERDPRDHARRVADGHEAAAPAQRPQRGLGEVAADRVDDDVGAVGQARRAAPGARSTDRWSIEVRRRRRTPRPSSFSADDATAVTDAPSTTPSCTAARPTPPPAPSTTAPPPAARPATERSTWYAVRCATPNAAAMPVVDAVGDAA